MESMVQEALEKNFNEQADLLGGNIEPSQSIQEEFGLDIKEASFMGIGSGGSIACWNGRSESPV